MTQPLPDAAAQRAAALDVYAVYEPTLYQGYLDMIAQWLAAVRVAMFTGGVTQLALMPDPFTVFAKTPEWNKLVTSYGDTIVRGVLAEPYAQILGDDTVFATRPFVHNWIADRQNKLAKTPTEVFGLVKTIVDNATSNGASIPDVADQIHDLLDATHGEQWKNRAQTVARTEVVGAYNGGLHDAFGMIVDAQPDRSYFKRWLATDDTRTRPDHREADGQLAAWSQPFVVGGFPMMHPHDPAAPAREVINCRCTELLELAGEPTDMTNRQYLGAAAHRRVSMRLAAAAQGFAFDESLHPRGPGGKWVHVGAVVEHAVHGKGTVTETHALGKVSVRFHNPGVGLKKVSAKELVPSRQDHHDAEAAARGESLRDAARRVKPMNPEALKISARDRMNRSPEEFTKWLLQSLHMPAVTAPPAATEAFQISVRHRMDRNPEEFAKWLHSAAAAFVARHQRRGTP